MILKEKCPSLNILDTLFFENYLWSDVSADTF